MVKTAIIPAAGLGTRLLPISAAVAKELLPLGRKPTLQWIGEELGAAGLDRFVLVSSPAKTELPRLFQWPPGLGEKYRAPQYGLWAAGPYSQTRIDIALQHQQLGLGHAVLCARDLVGDEPFVVALGDCVFGPPEQGNVTRRLVELFEAHQADAVLAFERVPREKVSRYGIAAPLARAAEPGAGARTRLTREQMAEGRDEAAEPGAGTRNRLTEEVFTLGDLIEKPSLEAAPSNLAVAARYVFSPRLWPHLVQLSSEKAARGVGGEIQLTDAIRSLIRSGAKVLGWEVQQQRRYDVGTYETYVEAQLAFGEEEGNH
ncbi:MAG: sugar phosphate nucleotidyltransferase [Planctomycetota bacterium]